MKRPGRKRGADRATPAPRREPALPALRDRVKAPKPTRLPRPPKPPRIPRTVAGRRWEWRRHLPGVAVALVVAALTWIVSWWTIPIVAVLAAVVWRRRGDAVRQIMWGAVAGWGALLLVDSLHGRSWALARAVGGILYLPAPLFFLLTLAFAAGLAWSAAVVARAAMNRW